jgi:hypothetical protein
MNLNAITLGLRTTLPGEYSPAASFDFLFGGSALDSRITFTRASNASYFDSTGTLQTAASGVARSNAHQDHDPATLAPLGFLIEEQRTNLFVQSGDFTTTWGVSNATITGNSVAGPDGTVAADTLAITVAGGATNQTTQSFTAGSTVTLSIFAKKNASNFVRFEVAGVVNCWFNLDTGAVATNGAGSGNVLFSSKSIQALPNGWYRCSLTVTTTVVTSLGVLIFATNADNTTSANGSSIYVWGAQAEVGAFATSYIATTTAAATRLADVASITGTAFSSFYNAVEGTWRMKYMNAATSPAAVVVQIQKDTTGFDQYLVRDGSALGGSPGSNDLSIRSGNVSQMDSAGPVTTINTLYTTAFRYKVNDCAICTGGGTVFSDTSVTLPVGIVQLQIGSNGAGGNFRNGWMQDLAFYNRAFADATIQSLTV